MGRSGFLLTLYEAEDDPDLLVLFCFVPELWNYRSALPCLAQILICKMFFRKTTMRLRVQCSDRACAQIVLGSRFDPW